MSTVRSASDGRITRYLAAAPPAIFVGYATVAAFATYFCMYAFRKPFAAASFEGQTFFGIVINANTLDLKTVLVISQIVGYALSKYIGIKVCSEVTRGRRFAMLIGMILCAEAALVLYGAVPDNWKFVMIFLNGLPLGMVWGLVVWYLEGRRTSELLLAGLSCSYILASGIVKNVGQVLMGEHQLSEGWMPAAVGALFLPLFLLSAWMLNQIPQPTPEDEAARTHREPMDGLHRLAFVRHFFWGILMLVVAYFFLTAYRDYRDNYQKDLFAEMGIQYDDTTDIVDGQEIVKKGDKAAITRAETTVAFGVLVPLGLLFLIRKNRWGLIATFVIMISGVALLGGSALAYQREQIDGFWFMTLVGLGAYLAYVPYGSVLFDRLIASTHIVGTSVFAIYLLDALGYTGSVAVQIYRDVIYRNSDVQSGGRLAFFIDFTYLMSMVGALMLIGSCLYFLRHGGRKAGQFGPGPR